MCPVFGSSMERPISRARWLQETRKMRFEEAYAGWQGKRLTQQEAGQLLGVSERTFRRQIGRFETGGMDGLIDLRMSQVSSRRAPVDEVLGGGALVWFGLHGLEREALSHVV